MAQKQPYRFIISGGGTGGHIYPALAVANEIKSRYSEAEILFVGAKGKMEMTRVPEAGYKIHGLWISGFQRRVTIENLYFPFKVLVSFFSAKKILRKFRPDAVLGFGGYASGPTMLVATGKKLPTLIQEQNSFAGLTNRKLGNRVSKICVAYDQMERYFPKSKIRYTGNPVRKEIIYASQRRKEGIAHFGLDPNKKTVLVLGGSLGARTINQAMLDGVERLIEAGHQVLWQIGKFYFVEISKKLKKMNLENLHPKEFIKEMDLAYGAADMVISRAGALSVSELCLAGKPVIFVPSPNVAEDHQTKNAMSIVAHQAAEMITDNEANEKLITTALDLLKDDERRKNLASNIKKLARPNATSEIVDEVMEMIQ